MIFKKIFFPVFVTYLLFNISNLNAQEEYVKDDNLLRNHDFVYLDDINTVNFYPLNAPLGYPIIGLNDGSRLELTFDDLTEDVRDYQYEIIHCNADWQPSELSEMDYLDGFNMEVITEYEFSFNTLTNYINYRLVFPNQNAKVTKSGNYLMHIFEDGDRELPILTRRFQVAERNMQIVSNIARTGAVSKSRTHQEIDFIINHKGINISNPHNDVKVIITQNGRWDNAITDLQPLFIREEQLVYDFQDKIVFPAGKEFRNFNTQSLEYRTERVVRIIEDKVDKYHVELFPEKPRTSKNYSFFNDLNGKYVIENDDDNGNPHIRADYAWVHFSLAKPLPFDDAEVYLFGKMTDWSIQDQFKLEYVEDLKMYRAKVFLKQGYYDYQYAFVKGAGSKPKLEEIEGNWHETENDYHIFVYYRPIGGRYDRLAAFSLLNSNQ